MSSPQMFANGQGFTFNGGEFNAVGGDNYKHEYYGSYMANSNNNNTTTNVNSHNRQEFRESFDARERITRAEHDQWQQACAQYQGYYQQMTGLHAHPEDQRQIMVEPVQPDETPRMEDGRYYANAEHVAHATPPAISAPPENQVPANHFQLPLGWKSNNPFIPILRAQSPYLFLEVENARRAQGVRNGGV